METVAVVRKWGNSLGVTLPKELVERQNVREGDILSLPVVIKKASLRNVFGSIKTGESGQKFKDRAREGWGKQ
ncbi:AbrB/MazE/SpoVT family DNA-binding domain-containing protein [Candidatus Woesearchaeota archaeon]|nr:AbrB/MazE/SpoVT family DNA-binding domain-containing protein [Candidatus Woesearchaeota archaeon]